MAVNKQSILLKSRELFERFGYQKTTLTDIAKSVGKVKTAIYYYFSGKEEIFAQLVQVEAEEFYLKLRAVVEAEEDPQRKLEMFVTARIHLMQEISKRYHFLKEEFLELLPIVEKNRAVYYKLEIELIQRILEEGQARSDFQVVAPQFSATMLVNSLKGLEIQMFVTDQIVVEGLDLEAFRNFILYGCIQSNPVIHQK